MTAVASESTMRQPSLGAKVASAIRRDIVVGAIPPGSVLVQERLCETYDVSRIPVRDALISLLHEGFVARNHRNQMVAAAFTSDDVLDTFQIEALLCGLGARRATRHLSDDELTELDLMLRAVVTAGDTPDRAVSTEGAWEFHRRINRAASSPRLTAALRAVSISFAQDFMREVPEWWRISRRQHRDILDALVDRDPDRAEMCMRHHFESAGEHLTRFVEARARRGVDDDSAVPRPGQR